MTGNRQRGAWIWVAVAAISLASLARAQSGIETARAYATPLMAFISGHQDADSGASASAYGVTSPAHGGNRDMGLGLLPVFFVGLISPLSLLAPRLALSPGRAFPKPALPGLFQRPPPALLS